MYSHRRIFCAFKLAGQLRAVRADKPAEQLDAAAMQLIADISREVDEEHIGILEDSARATQEAPAAEPTAGLRQKVLRSIADLQKGLLERETEVRLMLLAALAGEHLLLLGPPGTAKSELSRRLSRLTGGRYYERLLTRFSVPEELFGPLSMRGLENDEYVRQIDGYLPTAEVAFVDEIFKANSAILNALLTLLNERLFDNGNQRLPVPLLCLVGASNELPESEELDALYDRFLLRRQVAQVSSGQLSTLARLAAGTSLPPAEDTVASASGAPAGAPLTMDDFRAANGQAIASVELPEAVVDVLTGLRNWLQDKAEPPVYVSDRRFMKAINMLQVAAHADGRQQVSEYDCLLLEHIFGNRPADSTKVRTWVLETLASDPGLQQTELLFLGQFGRSCRLLEERDAQELEVAKQEVQQLVELLHLRQRSLSGTLGGGFPQLRASLWHSKASITSAAQALTPQMTENKAKVEDLLREALILRATLEQQTSPSILERLLPKRFKQYQKGISSRA
ncbi:hypothetical protein WJX73_001073 [Symbiochloris irregularis]|uniref:AAA+ ATPase domain-containing protein n=1 Tax=Symbiochloris irregularis TaxID=706552 RepID=A0AAW1PN63_9CHLO